MCFDREEINWSGLDLIKKKNKKKNLQIHNLVHCRLMFPMFPQHFFPWVSLIWISRTMWSTPFDQQLMTVEMHQARHENGRHPLENLMKRNFCDPRAQTPAAVYTASPAVSFPAPGLRCSDLRLAPKSGCSPINPSVIEDLLRSEFSPCSPLTEHGIHWHFPYSLWL